MSRTLPFLVTIIVALSLAATGTAVGADASAEMVTVTVSAVDPAGSPIGNVGLTASWAGGSASTTTASNGKAFLDVPAGANVTIETDHRVFVRNHPLEVTDASEESVTIEMAPKSSATVTVTGESGPIEGARVRLRKDGRVAASGRTNPDGVFESDTIMAGEYTIAAVKPGYFLTAETVSVRGSTSHEVALEPGTVTVTFRVLDRNFEPPRPVPDAVIEGEAIGSLKTQADGVQRVGVPANSQVEVTVRKDGYRTVERTIDVAEDDREVTVATRKELRISFDLLNERVVVGEEVRVAVTDQYGNPVREATVYRDGSPVGTTDDDGVVLVTIDAPGEHTIHAEAESLGTERHAVTGVRPATADGTTPPPSTEDGEATPGPSERAANADASLSGVVSVPGAGESIHLRSLGVGAGIGAVLVVVLVGYLRLRFRSGGD